MPGKKLLTKSILILMTSHIFKYLLVISMCLVGRIYGQKNRIDPETCTQAKVLILGAGMSGIMAAKTLSENGENDFIILEGTDRIGGRTRNVNFQGYNIELGSQWIHGSDYTNPIYREAIKRDVKFQLADYDDWTVRNDTGHNITQQAEAIYERLDRAMDELDMFREVMITENRPDTSVRNTWRYFGWEPRAPLDYLCEWYEADFEHACPEEMSAKYDTHPAFEGADSIITDKDGYGKLHSSLLNDVITGNNITERLKLGTVVKTIEYHDNYVNVISENGDTYYAEHVVITFSVGVLQQNDVQFIPKLPEWKLESIHGFPMADYMHFMMKFPYQFWDDTEYILHPSSRSGYYPFFLNWNTYKPGSNLLQATVAGREALRLHDLTNTEIAKEVMAVLRQMYGNTILDPIDIVVPRWSTDPFFMGCYPHWPPGFDPTYFEAICAPLKSLYFAGDACNRDHFGFVHGAYLSGIETGRKLVDCIQNDNCPKQYTPPYAAKEVSSQNRFDHETPESDSYCYGETYRDASMDFP